nr:immunoglobulin heavy chain junction region [Mus musculus]
CATNGDYSNFYYTVDYW